MLGVGAQIACMRPTIVIPNSGAWAAVTPTSAEPDGQLELCG
jgi:hypothetical protein